MASFLDQHDTLVNDLYALGIILSIQDTPPELSDVREMEDLSQHEGLWRELHIQHSGEYGNNSRAESRR